MRLFRAARRNPILAAWALIAPALILRCLTGLWPFVDTLWISFQRSNPLLGPDKWIGLENYRALFEDVAVRQTLFFTALYTVVSTALEIVLGVAVALLLNRRFRLTGFVRTINLMPWAIPVVITGIAFRFAFDASTGVFAYWLSAIGIHADWLTSVVPARTLVILTNVWRNAPFVAVLVLAALQGIPSELYEAAEVDGAGRFQVLRRITLPLILPVIVTIGVFFLIWQVATFDLVLAMTGGGPGNATQVLGYEAYLTAFTQLDFGKGSALGILLFVFVAVFGFIGAVVHKRAEVKL